VQISICKLTYELLDDWLSYFDKDAFSDNDEWCGCYCMCYHWDSKLQKNPLIYRSIILVFNRF